MIFVKFQPASLDSAGRMEASGHAGAEHGERGWNVLCAAFTALLGAMSSNLEKIDDDDLEIQSKADDGYAEISWKRQSGKNGSGISGANSVAEYTYTAIAKLAECYPGEIKAVWEEVST